MSNLITLKVSTIVSHWESAFRLEVFSRCAILHFLRSLLGVSVPCPPQGKCHVLNTVTHIYQINYHFEAVALEVVPKRQDLSEKQAPRWMKFNQIQGFLFFSWDHLHSNWKIRVENARCAMLLLVCQISPCFDSLHEAIEGSRDPPHKCWCPENLSWHMCSEKQKQFPSVSGGWLFPYNSLRSCRFEESTHTLANEEQNAPFM